MRGTNITMSIITFDEIFVKKDFILSSSGSNMAISGGALKIVNLPSIKPKLDIKMNRIKLTLLNLLS